MKSGALFQLSLYLAVLVPCVWALLMSTENWIFREILVQCLGFDSGYSSCEYFGFGSISHIFFVAADSNPDCVSSPFGLNGEECPVDASGCSFCSALLALGILDILLELHVADTCDEGVDFSKYFYSICLASSSELRHTGCQFMPQLVDINLPRDGRV